MKHLTLDQRRSRMANLKATTVANISYGKRMYIHDYLPGHADYTYTGPAPDCNDFERLQKLAALGVDVLHFKADNYDAENVKRFTDLCHYFGLRVILPVTDWTGAPGALWRNDVQPEILRAVDTMGFDGVCADMRQWDAFDHAAHDPELEDMLWQLYNQVKSRGGILVLRTLDDREPPCIDKVYDYLLTGKLCPVLDTAGYLLSESADGFAAGIPFLQLPVLTEGNCEQWARYRKLYAPMTEENTLAYLDLKESTDVRSVLPEGVHVSMFINDVKYLAVANLSGKPFTLELQGEWIDRNTDASASAFTVQPAQLLLLKQN